MKPVFIGVLKHCQISFRLLKTLENPQGIYLNLLESTWWLTAPLSILIILCQLVSNFITNKIIRSLNNEFVDKKYDAIMFSY